MGVFTRQQYSRSQTMDLETAMANAVISLVDRPFPGPQGRSQIQLAQIFEDWADFEDNFVDPSGCILPDTEVVYGPSHPTPVLLEDTWEPRGEGGFGLYELAEATREFELSIRASTALDRQALKAGIETSFQQDGVLIAPVRGVRTGTIVTMPGYWNLPCRLTLLASRKLDDAESAARKVEEARFRILAHAANVKLAPVQPFRLHLRTFEVLDDGTIVPLDGQPPP